MGWVVLVECQLSDGVRYAPHLPDPMLFCDDDDSPATTPASLAIAVEDLGESGHRNDVSLWQLGEFRYIVVDVVIGG